MPYPKPKEKKTDYIDRCMSNLEMKSKHPNNMERLAVCNSFFTEQDAIRVSFDYDGTLTTDKGMAKAKEQTGLVYIISARRSKENMLEKAKELNIPESRVYATGSNQEKLNKIKELGINTHYDNNPSVIKKLGKIGKLIIFLIIISINSYSQQSFKINEQVIEFKSDSTFKAFENKLVECFNDKNFNFTDVLIDNNYLLISKVLTLGEPKLYVSSFGGTVVIRKSKLKRFR